MFTFRLICRIIKISGATIIVNFTGILNCFTGCCLQNIVSGFNTNIHKFAFIHFGRSVKSQLRKLLLELTLQLRVLIVVLVGVLLVVLLATAVFAYSFLNSVRRITSCLAMMWSEICSQSFKILNYSIIIFFSNSGGQK